MSAIAMIAEKDATGKVKEIYTEIMVNIGIDFVPNIYKVMAVKPDYLESNYNKIKTFMHNSTKLDTLRMREFTSVLVQPLVG
jgi:hypothetical protein